MKMGTITSFGDRTSSAFLICLVLSDEDNSDSRTDNFVNECFHQCYISSCTLLPLRFALFLDNASGL